MLQHFSRRAKADDFRIRSAERDELSDWKTIAPVGKAIDEAIATLKAEGDGLGRRFEEARDRAAIAVGTEHDEYLSREPAMLTDLRRLEEQVSRATSRLEALHGIISDLQSLRAVFHSRFGASVRLRDGF